MAAHVAALKKQNPLNGMVGGAALYAWLLHAAGPRGHCKTADDRRAGPFFGHAHAGPRATATALRRAPSQRRIARPVRAVAECLILQDGGWGCHWLAQAEHPIDGSTPRPCPQTGAKRLHPPLPQILITASPSTKFMRVV